MQLANVDALRLLAGEFGRQPVEVERGQLVEERASGGTEPVAAHAQRRELPVEPGALGAENVRGSAAGGDRGCPYVRFHRVEQRPGHVLFGRQRPDHRASGVTDGRRVGAEKHGRGIDPVAVERHGDRQVVPLEPPTPSLVAGRVTEDDHPVVVAVPTPTPALGPVEDLLQRDDRHRLCVRGRAQRRGEQPMRGLARGWVKVGEAHARPGMRAVLDPPPHRVVGERVPGKLALLVVESIHQCARPFAHRGRRGSGWHAFIL